MLKAVNDERSRELDWQHWSRRWGNWSQWRATYSSAQVRKDIPRTQQQRGLQDFDPALDSKTEHASHWFRRKQSVLTSLHASASAWLKQMKFTDS